MKCLKSLYILSQKLHRLQILCVLTERSCNNSLVNYFNKQHSSEADKNSLPLNFSSYDNDNPLKPKICQVNRGRQCRDEKLF